MKSIIVGLPQAGAQQLFALLTGISLEQVQQKPLEAQPGICQVSDSRIIKLSALYQPAKTTFVKIEYLLLPDFNLQGPAKALIYKELKNTDEICWVCRLETAEKDITNLISDLVFHDFALIEKRLENIAKEQRSKHSEQRAKEKELLLFCKKQLESGERLIELEMPPAERQALLTYQFLTLKPLLLVINVPEDKIKEDEIAQQIEHEFGCPTVQLSVEIENEIRQLSESERKEYLTALGISQPAIARMSQLAFRGLGLLSFFTVGEDEVRAWPLPAGASAVTAGGVIHSDIAKGFVRAEMFKYHDLISAGSEAKLKEQGKFHLKGKDYLVEDGDILSFRFNV